MIESRPLTDYSDPRPYSKIGRVRTALIYLLDQHRRDGALPTSVRFLFYELVMQRIVAKEGDRPDKIVSAALTDCVKTDVSPGIGSSTRPARFSITPDRQQSQLIGCAI